MTKDKDMADKKEKTVKPKKAKEKPEKKLQAAEEETVETVETPESEEDFSVNETAQFSGKYIKAVGRRKQSVAKVRLYEGGKGIIMVNGLKANQYFAGEGSSLIAQPLKATGHARDFNFSVLAQGGGKQGQVGAVRLGISRALLAFDPATKEALKVNGFLTRDPRQVERKKPGLRKARKSPQWSKR